MKSTAVARFKLHRNLTVICSEIGNKTYRQSVSVHCEKDKTDDRMIKEFLLHKDKVKLPSHKWHICFCPDPQSQRFDKIKRAIFPNVLITFDI